MAVRSEPLVMVIEDERPISWNEIYRGGQAVIRLRSSEAERVHLLVRGFVDDPNLDPFEMRVDIYMIVYFKADPYDPCNIPVKFYIDGLRHAWVITDDDLKYVRRVTTEAAIDEERPRIEIHVSPVKEDDHK